MERSETPVLTLAEYRALATFRRELRKFLDFSSSAAQSAGVPSQQYQALLAIKGHLGDGAPSISELAAHLLVRQHTAVELTKRLEKSGLVRREPHPSDRRVVVLYLTDKAEAVLAALATTHLLELQQSSADFVRVLEQIQHRQPASR